MSKETNYVVPAVAMNETPEEYTFTFEIPGIPKENVELGMEGRTLTLKTDAVFQTPAGFKQAVAEFQRVNYAVSVDLPELADANTVKAACENGLLKATVAKKPETKARKIAIA